MRLRQAVPVAGLVVLLLGVSGVDAALAGPPDHAGGSASGASDPADKATPPKSDKAAPPKGAGAEKSASVSAQRLSPNGQGSSGQAPPAASPGRDDRASAQSKGGATTGSSNAPAAGNRAAASQSAGSERAASDRGNGGASERGNGGGPPASAASPGSTPSNNEPSRTPPGAEARPGPTLRPGSPPEQAPGPPEDRPAPPAEDRGPESEPEVEGVAADAPRPDPADGATAPMAAPEEPTAGAAPTGASSPGIDAPVPAPEPVPDAAPDLDLGGVLAAGPDSAAPPPAAGHAQLLDRLSGGTSRVVDTVLTPGRDFGVPALLVATLGVYLLVQRRLDRGALPMSALASSPDGNPTHVRFEL